MLIFDHSGQTAGLHSVAAAAVAKEVEPEAPLREKYCIMNLSLSQDPLLSRIYCTPGDC